MPGVEGFQPAADPRNQFAEELRRNHKAALDRVFPDQPYDEQTFLTGEADTTPEPEPEKGATVRRCSWCDEPHPDHERSECPDAASRVELPNETSMVIYDSRGWRIDARPGEVKLRSQEWRSMTPADISDLMQALNFARGRARGQGEDEMGMRAW